MASCSGCGTNIGNNEWTCGGGMKCYRTRADVRGTVYESASVSRRGDPDWVYPIVLLIVLLFAIFVVWQVSPIVSRMFH